MIKFDLFTFSIICAIIALLSVIYSVLSDTKIQKPKTRTTHWSFCKFCDKPVNLREQLHFSYNFTPNFVPTNEPWWCPHCFVTNDMYKVFNTKREAKKAGKKRRKEYIKWELWHHSHYDVICIPREIQNWWFVTVGSIKRRYYRCRRIIRGHRN